MKAKMPNFIVLDVETTGLDKRSSRIISIGAKRIGSGPFEHENPLHPVRTRDIFHAFVNPELANTAFDINKIPDSHLAKFGPFDDVIHDFWNWVWEIYQSRPEPVVFVGHNFDSFDEAMLIIEHSRHSCQHLIPARTDLPMFKLDTMKLVKYVLPQTIKSVPYGLPVAFHGPQSYRQADIYEFLFGETPNLCMQHSALGDVLALERILMHPTFARLLSQIEHPDPLTMGYL
jgi:DNA polymerase III epsilon subunit-like protein